MTTFKQLGRLPLAVGILTLLLAPVSWPAPAEAHAALVSSSPEQGAQLAEPPTVVRFDFSEDMSDPAYVIVTAPDGSAVADGDPEVDGAVVTQAVAGGSQGTWTMAYRAVSEDGHPVTGEITFIVGEAADPAPAPSGAVDSDSGSDGDAAAATPAAAAEAAAEAAVEAAVESAVESEAGPPRALVVVLVAAVLFGGSGLLLLLSRRRSHGPATSG